MKKYLYLNLIIVCCGCVTQIKTEKEIEQKIAIDESIIEEIEKLKVTEEYTKIKKIAAELNAICKKNKFTANDVKKIKLYYAAQSLKEKYNSYWYSDDALTGGTFHWDFKYGQTFDDRWNQWYQLYRNNDYYNEHEVNIVKLSMTAAYFAYEYCKPYYKTPNSAIFNTCDDTLKSLLYSKLFNDIDYDNNAIAQKEQYYNDKEFEKRTGCKVDKVERFVGGAYEVFQQTKDGTLVNLNFMYAADPFTPKIFLITKNKIDSVLVDGSHIQDGTFQDIGIYQYKSVTGGLKTVKKYKRCE